MTIGGSALTHALREGGARRGMHIGAGYGMSESGPTLTMACRDVRPDDRTHDVDALKPAGSRSRSLTFAWSTKLCATCRMAASRAANWSSVRHG